MTARKVKGTQIALRMGNDFTKMLQKKPGEKEKRNPTGDSAEKSSDKARWPPQPDLTAPLGWPDSIQKQSRRRTYHGRPGGCERYRCQHDGYNNKIPGDNCEVFIP